MAGFLYFSWLNSIYIKWIMNMGLQITLWGSLHFFWIYAQMWDCWIIWWYCFYFYFILFIIEYIEIILANKIIQVSSVQFHNTSSVNCIVCSPPQLFLILWGNPILFSIVAVPIYISTNIPWRFFYPQAFSFVEMFALF